jgi:hypothetical protein
MSSGFGVLEFWSIGVLEKAKNPKDATFESFCITPLLHHSITPACRSMRESLLKLPLGVAGSLGPVFFPFIELRNHGVVL